MLAPFTDPEWTIWGSSPGNQGALPRVDAWFEMHVNLMWPEYRSYGEPYLRWLNDQKFPVVAQDQRFIPRAITYPLDEMIAKFGPYFFTSTFSWMMAYAIHINVEAMALYGVDMASKDEYIQQRSGGHYFITIARQRGIQVIIPEESDLEQPPPLYGYVDGTPFGRKLAARELEVKARIQQLEQQMETAKMQVTYLRGATEDIEYCKTVWSGIQLTKPWHPAGNHAPVVQQPEPQIQQIYQLSPDMKAFLDKMDAANKQPENLTASEAPLRNGSGHRRRRPAEKVD
jgi:hypothetical protein